MSDARGRRVSHCSERNPGRKKASGTERAESPKGIPIENSHNSAIPSASTEEIPGIPTQGIRGGSRCRMARHDPGIAAVLDQLIAEHAVETAAQRELERQRAIIQRSMRGQAALLDQLAAGGVPFTTIAHALSAAAGVPLPVKERRRWAERLWKRRRRSGAWTSSPLNVAAPSPTVRHASLTSNETPTAAESGQELEMPKLVKRTVVEHYEVDELDDTEMDDLED